MELLGQAWTVTRQRVLHRWIANSLLPTIKRSMDENDVGKPLHGSTVQMYSEVYDTEVSRQQGRVVVSTREPVVVDAVTAWCAEQSVLVTLTSFPLPTGPARVTMVIG